MASHEEDQPKGLTRSKSSSFGMSRKASAESMSEKLKQGKRRMMAKVANARGLNNSKKPGYYPSNVTMRGRLFKKRKGIQRLTATALTLSLTNDPANIKNRLDKLWPLRYMSLKDGVMSYYKLHDGGEEAGNETSSNYSKTSYRSDSDNEASHPHDEDSRLAEATERGSIDLRRTGVMLRLSYPTNSFGQEFQHFSDGSHVPGKDDYHHGKSATQYQFEIVYNNIMNPKEWNTWTLCAPTKESFFSWLNAISSVIYATRGAIEEVPGVATLTPHWIDADKEEDDEDGATTQPNTDIAESNGAAVMEDDTTAAELSTSRKTTGKVHNTNNKVMDFVKRMKPSELSAPSSVVGETEYDERTLTYHQSRSDVLIEMVGLLCLINIIWISCDLRSQPMTTTIIALTAWHLLLFSRVYSWINFAEWTGWSKASIALNARSHTHTTDEDHFVEDSNSTEETKMEISEHLVFDARQHGWTYVPRDVLHMRIGPDYKSNRRKAPANDPFFIPISVEMYQASSKIDHIMQHKTMPLDKITSEALHGLPEHIPKLLVFNLQLPITSGMFGIMSSSDNEYYNFIMYYTPSPAFVSLVKRIEDGQALEEVDQNAKLVYSWLKNCQTDQTLKHRLKLLNVIMNPDEAGLPGYLAKYNGKPCMVTRSATLHRDIDQGYLEVDVDSNSWGLLTRKAIGVLIPGTLKRCILSLGFIIQGDTDEELPERPMTAIQLVYIDAKHVQRWAFDSTSKKHRKGRRKRTATSPS